MDNNDLVQEIMRKSFYRLTLEECKDIVKLISINNLYQGINTNYIYDSYYNETKDYENFSFKNAVKYDIKKAFDNCIEEGSEYGEDVVYITNTNLLYGNLLNRKPIVVERHTRVFNNAYEKNGIYKLFISVPDIEFSGLKEFNRNKFSFLLGNTLINNKLKEKIISDLLEISSELTFNICEIQKDEIISILENENIVKQYKFRKKDDGVVFISKNYCDKDYTILYYTNPEKVFNEIICEKLYTYDFIVDKNLLKENPLTLFSDRAVFSEIQDILIKYYQSFIDGKSDNLEIIAFKSNEDLEKEIINIENDYKSNIECNYDNKNGGFCSETHFNKLIEQTIGDLKFTVINITVHSGFPDADEYKSSSDTTLLISCPRLF